MHNQFLKTLGDNRPLIVTIGIVGLFAAMLGCGGGGGGGGGTSATSTTSTSTTSTSTTSTSTTSTSTTSTSTTAGTTSESTGSTGSTLPANRIFFIDTTQDVKHMNPDGSDEQTYSPIDAGFKAFAQSPVDPNKKAFAFTSVQEDLSNPNSPIWRQYDIYVNSSVSLTGASKITAISKADVGSIMFTPDGSQIVFTMATGAMVQGDVGPVPEYSYQLFVVDASGSNQTPIPIDAADDAYVAPTGLKIVYTHWPLSAANPQVKICDITGANKVALTTNIPHGANYFPQYNKNGSQICFGSTRSGQFEIWKMNSNGSSPVQVTNINSSSDSRSYGSSFNSDGSEIAFTRLTTSDGSSGVYKVPSAGGTEVQIRPGFVQTWVYWSPVSSLMPGRSPGTASSPLSMGTSMRMKKFLGIEN